ncbi:hypothetical protein D3C81_900930 [compost metagenome]
MYANCCGSISSPAFVSLMSVSSESKSLAVNWTPSHSMKYSSVINNAGFVSANIKRIRSIGNVGSMGTIAAPDFKIPNNKDGVSIDRSIKIATRSSFSKCKTFPK